MRVQGIGFRLTQKSGETCFSGCWHTVFPSVMSGLKKKILDLGEMILDLREMMSFLSYSALTLSPTS